MRKKIIVTKTLTCCSVWGVLIQLLLVTVVQSWPSEGQRLREVKVTLTAANVTLEEAFKLLEQKTPYRFIYEVDRTPLHARTSLNCNGKSLYDVLKNLAEQFDVTFTQIDNQVVVRRDSSFMKSAPVMEAGIIKGKVIDSRTRAPLAYANVIIVGTSLGVNTSTEGEFLFSNIRPGNYRLKFQYVGYVPKETAHVTVLSGGEVTIDVELEERAVQLSDVVVTPGRMMLMGSGLQSRQILTQKELQNVSFAEDIFRAVSRLPGISASDFSAKFSIRGGEANEILVLFDGVQLYEPFHMKDFAGGILSIIDANAIGGIDIMTGGFSAEYGDRMSGVFNMTSLKPESGMNKISLGLSLMNARLFSQGTFDDDKGSWILSARRGYLDLVLKMMDELNSPSPKYYDVYAKGEYKLHDRHTLSVSILQAEDRLEFNEEDLDFSKTSYNNTYGWLTLNSLVSPSMTARTVASFGRVAHLREGTGYKSASLYDLDFRAKDDRNVSIANLKQDWSWQVALDYLFSWGFDARISSADYRYSSAKVFFLLDTNLQVLKRTGRIIMTEQHKNNQYAGYLSNRIQILEPLTAEVGIRYDYSTIVRKGDLSPRVNLAYAFGKETFVRAGWGYFYQTQNLYELNIPDGDNRFFPAEKTANLGVGFEHSFANGIHLRIEAYDKRLSHLRPVYRNLFAPLEIFPELQDDRAFLQLESARTKGIEVFVKYDVGERFSWWATYAYASSIERIKGIDLDIPRPYNQKHTFCLDANYRPTEAWCFSLAFQYRTGWPRTEKWYISTPVPSGGNIYSDKIGPYMGSRFPDYHRLDVRVSRSFQSSFGRFDCFVEVINLYNRTNLRAIEYLDPVYPQDEPAYYQTRESAWLPLLPSIGVSWSLDWK
jgi:outer membrane cobalamin receptor